MASEKPKRVCASVAKAEYGLSEKDLDALSCDLSRNPHYRCAASMRLYLVSDVQAASDAKKIRRQYELEHADEIALSKAECARALRKKLVKDARDAVAGFPATVTCLQQQHGDFPLPPDVLAVVLCKVADSVEPEGLRGPGVVAQDICNAALVCRDMRHAAIAAMQHLGTLLEPMPRDLPVEDWNELVRRPMSFTLPTLRTAARALDCPTSGAKSELVVRLLAQFGLQAPGCGAPPSVLRHVFQERCMAMHPGKTFACTVRFLSSDGQCDVVRRAMVVGRGSLRMMRQVLATKYAGMNDLVAAAAGAAARIKREEEEARRRQHHPRRLPPSTALFWLCCGQDCDRTPAAACPRRMCASCCRLFGDHVTCARHTR